ncbi:MAG: imidazolonepropionase [Bacteroidia bacterium]|nr:imidazolonepropionase [Bacteroidia bacterium]NNF31968.1 imidazolonepropionase [Flavobacteriaceae bacterium]MBT8276194.1 imidazolonepropionase [Bacteroidia bacterium]NNJ83058.1 imidazolonepropionase [Flavobacteriaceae bacterium]NNK52969.1 imidazolonepropionase [Flavobacteriaceae bacterium]
MNVLLTNIKQLLQVRDSRVTNLKGAAMKELPTLENAWLLIENGVIHNYGDMVATPTGSFDKTIDCSGKIVLPSWCDSHTHIVFAGNREQEFVDRINGLSYQEIAEKGGGILNSARKLQETGEDDLYMQSAKRLEEVMKLGTGAIEIKSGYGLTKEAEMKMLRVAKRLDKAYPVTVKTTFLGAHAVPEKFKDKKEDYIQLICDEMLPAVSAEGLADYVDVFCEDGYFSVEDTDKILTAANKYGLVPKIHVNQFNSIGGVSVGVKHKALTVDHLEIVSDDDIRELQHSETMPVALPACSFFLGIPYTPGRALIDAGLPLAIATDYNPGSSPTGNMNFVVAAACIKMNLTPEEAINAATVNAAYAMGLSKTHGSITKGKKANLIITKEIPSYGFLPYSFGSNCIDSVICNGELL